MAVDLKVKPLVVSGTEFPMHSNYAFEKQKLYATDNERSLDFIIRVFSQKGFVPYFTVRYACVPLEIYETMCELIAPDEVPVQYFDTTTREYKTAYFYVQQPTYEQELALGGNHKYILGLEMVFTGTLHELLDNMNAMVTFDANGGTGTAKIEDKIGTDVWLDFDNGEISKEGYSLSHWNTQADGSGRSYAIGARFALRDNELTLYAQWKAN